MGTLLGWEVTNVSKTTADVDIFDVIGDPYDGVSAAAFVKQLRALKVDTINFWVNSPGGYVNDALAMFNAVKMAPATTNAYVIGAADSAASFLVQAMDNRFIAENASMFIHRAQSLAMGDEDAMEAARDALHENSIAIAGIYAARAGGTVDDWLERMSAPPQMGTQYRGQEAVDAGLVDKVGLPVTNRDLAKIAALRPAPRRAPGRIAAQLDVPQSTILATLSAGIYDAYTDTVQDWLKDMTITVEETTALTGVLGPLLASLEAALTKLGLADRQVDDTDDDDDDDDDMGMMKRPAPVPIAANSNGLGDALRAARLSTPTPSLQQLLEEHQREPLSAAFKGA